MYFQYVNHRTYEGKAAATQETQEKRTGVNVGMKCWGQELTSLGTCAACFAATRRGEKFVCLGKVIDGEATHESW
jgi:hypothetical protein